jgi:catechol 2,3-dioxygenase-like lactoylglutathione lyase family enzyme
MRPQEEETMRPLGLFHVTLYTRDYEASKVFYLAMGCEPVSEWTEALVGGQRAQFSGLLLDAGNGSHIELSPAPPNYGEEHNPIAHHLSLVFEDGRAAYTFALQNGAKAHRIHPGWDGSPLEVHVEGMKNLVAFVRGPGGELLEILQRL